MKGIGGNIHATIQVYTSTRNEIGEQVQNWTDVQTIRGWLDLQAGDSKYQTFSAKIQESTHIFISDYVPLADNIQAENSRMIIKGKVFDILLIDNPMEMGVGSQLEFYLKYTGGQNG